ASTSSSIADVSGRNFSRYGSGSCLAIVGRSYQVGARLVSPCVPERTTEGDTSVAPTGVVAGLGRIMQPVMSELNAFIGNEREFPILGKFDFFNHAGVAPIPKRAADVLRAYAE